MSKKDYIDAINEIEVSEKLKKDTFSKTSKISTSTKYNKIYPIASLTLMCAIILAIILPNKNIAPISEINYQDVETSQELPKVENFRNLYAMLKTRAKNDNNSMVYTDKVFENATEDSSNIITDSAQTGEQDYSETNTQVEGVDEADIVKTDGKYIYYLTNNKLTITDTTKMIKITITLGLSSSGNPQSFQKMLIEADKNLIKGKNDGRNRVVSGYYGDEES